MDYILDTHIAMWAIEGNERLSEEAVEIISNENNNIYFFSFVSNGNRDQA